MLSTNSVNLMIAVTFCFGLFTSFRTFVGFIFFMELIPRSGHILLGTAFLMIEIILSLCVTVYFGKFESRNWLYPASIGFIMQFYGFVGAIFLPESPKFLIETNQFKEAEESLKQIAIWNKKPLNFNSNNFVEENSFEETMISVESST